MYRSPQDRKYRKIHSEFHRFIKNRWRDVIEQITPRDREFHPDVNYEASKEKMKEFYYGQRCFVNGKRKENKVYSRNDRGDCWGSWSYFGESSSKFRRRYIAAKNNGNYDFKQEAHEYLEEIEQQELEMIRDQREYENQLLSEHFRQFDIHRLIATRRLNRKSWWDKEEAKARKEAMFEVREEQTEQSLTEEQWADFESNAQQYYEQPESIEDSPFTEV